MQLKIERKAGEAALNVMTQNVAARLDSKTSKRAFNNYLLSDGS